LALIAYQPYPAVIFAKLTECRYWTGIMSYWLGRGFVSGSSHGLGYGAAGRRGEEAWRGLGLGFGGGAALDLPLYGFSDDVQSRLWRHDKRV
jgi:hypothetical protein